MSHGVVEAFVPDDGLMAGALVCKGPEACGLKLPDSAFHAAFFGSGWSGEL